MVYVVLTTIGLEGYPVGYYGTIEECWTGDSYVCGVAVAFYGEVTSQISDDDREVVDEIYPEQPSVNISSFNDEEVSGDLDLGIVTGTFVATNCGNRGALGT